MDDTGNSLRRNTNITFLKGKKGVLSRHFYARVMVPRCNGFTEEKPKAGM